MFAPQIVRAGAIYIDALISYNTLMLRKAKKADVGAIKSLIDSLARQGKLLRRSRAEIERVIRNFYVWDVDGEIVGCCALEIYNKKLAEIRSLAVHSDHQNMRIGSQLIDACVREAKHKQVYEVLCVTDKVEFFQKKGFSKQLGPDQWPLFIKP
jgi:amino-acid N-acetyltransferase